ncbi:uncharacterized protein cfap92 [Amia ocellicauda]|uniref:uncharacterized protein cfap92 n=1 Tax=Amia ocellicauda TaxID=2972642 RepID=UPI003463CE4F
MEIGDSEIPLEAERSNTSCSLKRQFPVGYDSGMATDEGGRETDQERLSPRSHREDRSLETPKSASSSTSRTSSLSGNSIQRETESSSTHTVTCTISITLAIPRGEEEEKNAVAEKAKKRPKNSSGIVEAPKAQSFYHIEYFLTPDDPEPTKIDLVMFGPAAKVYMENETKILKPWQDGDQTWLGWSQSLELKVNRELLIKLTSHKITFRVWDTKDRVSAKARYDRPKAFRLPQGRSGEDPDNAGGIKSMVQKQRKLFETRQPKSSHTGRQEKSCLGAEATRESVLNCVAVKANLSTTDIGLGEKFSSSAGLHTLLSAASEGGDVSLQRSISCSGEQEASLPNSKSTKLEAVPEQNETSDQLKSAQKSSVLDQSSKTLKHVSNTNIYPRKSNSARDKGLGTGGRRALCRATHNELAAAELLRKNGAATAELDPVHLLAGDTFVTNCLISSSPGVREGFCTVSVDKSLIPEELKWDLNPLVIKIESATCLPTSPVPIHELKANCAPVFCCYKFPGTNGHRTKGRDHGTHVYFNDVSVILTGLLSTGSFREFLGGSPLEIEVHDRDKRMEKPPTKPALFGTEPDDQKLSNVGLVSSKRTTHNPFQDKAKSFDPYGIAKVDLSGLLRGEKSVKVRVPIHSSPPPDPTGHETSGCEGRIVGLAGSVDGPQDSPFPTGHYLDSNSLLKVSVEITCPLSQESSAIEGQMTDCPFGRIVYICRSQNCPVATRLRSEIYRINAGAFRLESYPERLIENALSCYKLKPKERESRDLDIVTGFHVQDGKMHLFVLEGLRNQAIRRLWEKIPRKSRSADEGHVEVFYNSELGFERRLYAVLNMNVCQIHLHEPLADIMRQPLLYVRDMVPLACFQALSRLDLICQAKKLKDVTHSNLFPSAEMILSLSKEFGVILQREETLKGFKRSLTWDSTEFPPANAEAQTLHSPLSTHSADYMEWTSQMFTQDREGTQKDFIRDNIEEVRQASRKLRRPKPDTIVALPPPGKEAHNYSTQAWNSSQQARELLRREMAKEPSRRFTYSQQYQSATVEPVDVESEVKAAEARSKAAWRTCDGFTYPGIRSSIESNEHHRRPDDARTEELRKPWRENILHAKTLQPPLSRERWSWNKRHADFELYKRPPRFSSPEPPVTIYLAGDRLHEEQLQAARAQYLRWLNKVLATDDQKLSRRSLEFKCHTGGGKELLKDKPMKYSLRRSGMILKPIPALSVLQHVDSSGPEEAGRDVSAGFAPGLLENHSLCWDGNIIPRHNFEHKKFQQLKGQPFVGVWRERLFQCKRVSRPLTEEERGVYLFQRPGPVTEDRAVAVRARPGRNIVETKTCHDVFTHIV